MSYSLYANEYQWWDATESVTVTLDRAEGRQYLPGVTAKRGDESEARAVFAEVSAGGFDLLWTVPDTLLGGCELREGDLLTDASSVKWRITRLTRQRFSTQWVCLCVKESR